MIKINGNKLLQAINGFGSHLKADIGSMTPAKITLTTDGEKLGVYCARATFHGLIYAELNQLQPGENWTAVISAEEFAKFIKLVADKELQLDTEHIGDTNNLIVKFEGKTYKFKAIYTEFLGIPEEKSTALANIKGEDLINAINSVSYAVAKSNTNKPQLKAIHIKTDKPAERIRTANVCEALDGVRIARYYLDNAEILNSGEIIVKKDDFSFVGGLDPEQIYTISACKNQFILTGIDYYISIAQTCETYIPIDSITQYEVAKKYEIDKAEFVSALKRLMIFGSSAVKTAFQDKIQLIAEEDKGVASEIIENKGNPVGGELKSVGANPSLLLESASNIDTDKIKFILTTRNIFVMTGENTFAMVMPVRLAK